MTETPLFIAIEGLDGAGTTTQCELLCDWLSRAGRDVRSTREPSDGPVGRFVREILAGNWAPFDPASVALLFAADRVDHLAREIRPALAVGQDVVSDRYVLSSLAYQGRRGNLDWVRTINERADDPDLTIFIDLPVDVCLERVLGRSTTRDIYESREVLETVDSMYRTLLASDSQTNLVTVAGDGPVDTVFERVLEQVREKLEV